MYGSATEQQGTGSMNGITPPHPTIYGIAYQAFQKNYKTHQNISKPWFGFEPVGINIHKYYLCHLVPAQEHRGDKPRICVVGSGIAGNAAAYMLRDHFEVRYPH